MEISKGDDPSAEHAVALFGSPNEDKHKRHSDQGKKRRSKYCKIIIGALLLCLLVIIITVVFFTKRRSDVKVASCKRRCVTGSRDKAASCQCDPACEAEGSCCVDYQAVCQEPSQHWTCSKLRCGEERLNNSLCFCSDDCVNAGDCCGNYQSVCKGEKDSWLEEKCEDIEKPQCPPGFSKPPLILLSLDGFRAGYLAYGSRLPVISKLRNCGTSTPFMRPAYPTKTFPNHYTIVTGLYPESHGIVDNKMYDVNRNTMFSLKSPEKFNPIWYQGEPVWLTAMNNKLKSGTFFWPGADVAIKGKFPDFYKEYNKNIGFETRISTLLEWLDLPQGQRPDFYTLYMEEPDASGHYYGPRSSQVITALQNVDRLLGILMDGLKQRDLHRCVNVIVLSDHGMEDASCQKAQFVSSYQDNVEDFDVIQGPAARIRPKRLPDEFFSFDYAGLVKNLSCRAPDRSMTPYLKENLPKRMHFANNVRIERGHLYMKPGWQAALRKQDVKYCSGGFHGSDNLFTNMQAIFMGYGPGLKHKTVVPPFENIEVYNLMCDLLNIPPAPNNGTHGSLNHLLKNPVFMPVHPAQLSHDTPCEATDPLPTDELGCTCRSWTKTAEETMNSRLIGGDSSSKAGLRRLHLPYGTPHVLQENANYCLMHNSDYLNGYSKDILMPLWVAYTIQPLTKVQPLSPELQDCMRADVRVPSVASQMCLRYRDNATLSYGLLHPPYLSGSGQQTDSLVTSNMAPMFPHFKDIWAYLHGTMIPKFSQQLNGVNVMSGPIFDKDYDGNFDTVKVTTEHEAPIPTHYFVILTSCGNSTFSPEVCEGSLQAKAFILPHSPDYTDLCATVFDSAILEEWILFNVARIRDIELLTGLSFYHDRISVDETLQLKTFIHTP